VQNDGQWQRLCGLIGLAAEERFATVTSRVTHRDELQKLLERAFSAMTATELLAALDAADVPAALTRSITELPGHPQLDTWVDVRVPGGSVRMLPPPVAGFEWSPGAVPALGEHNDHVLRWLGYTDEELSSLRVRSVL
jgi:crotonobetainyl-CoA:carnitine CoA-transferase CaiB-like acyl-CoA transferase